MCLPNGRKHLQPELIRLKQRMVRRLCKEGVKMALCLYLRPVVR